MNSVNIIGRIASDILKFPVSKFNKNVIKFALAWDNRTRKTDGVKDTYFIDVEAWDVVADRIYETCKKGDRIAISGHLEQAKFTRRDGTKGSCIKIVISGVEFLFPKRIDKNPNDPDYPEDKVETDEYEEPLSLAEEIIDDSLPL